MASDRIELSKAILAGDSRSKEVTESFMDFVYFWVIESPKEYTDLEVQYLKSLNLKTYRRSIILRMFSAKAANDYVGAVIRLDELIESFSCETLNSSEGDRRKKGGSRVKIPAKKPEDRRRAPFVRR